MPRFAHLARVLAASMAVALPSLVFAQEPPPRENDAPPARSDAKDKSTARQPKTVRKRRGDNSRAYMGRPIAPVMSYTAADWLFRSTREEEERPDEMLDALKLKPGDVVADVGAGAGYTSMRLAKRVGPTGKVLATDVQPEMLQMLQGNLRAAGIKNVQPIRCTSADPKLPENTVDLILMVDVYHECAQPKATLKGLRKALKTGGRLVLVEFRAEDPNVPIKPEHKMSLAQVRKEVEPEGFSFKESLEMLPWQHIIIFEKPVGESDPKPADKADTPKP